jgi:hypothetical protein
MVLAVLSSVMSFSHFIKLGEKKKRLKLNL